MENEMVKKEVLKMLKENIASKLGTTENNKNFILQNVNVDEIYKSVNDLGNPEYYIKAFTELKNSNIQSSVDLINYITNLLVMEIGTAIIHAFIEIKLISERMPFEDQINLLIELKNTKDIDNIQHIVSNLLEQKINSNS
ncbi:hypothetical protein [Chryseobacterium kwangjuense]|uniref:Uncharacterized protein n=1 Tax=Chryseobacterium kwangjuense TaxID=267125 RepID=A0A135W2N7_9FLAO|nr:hypothetical protein [Chryseobacterium kwangjuense]KXH79069.1 hypothetical protein AU378_20640 [Chryseobacterium kwangjuense]